VAVKYGILLFFFFGIALQTLDTLALPPLFMCFQHFKPLTDGLFVRSKFKPQFAILVTRQAAIMSEFKHGAVIYNGNSFPTKLPLSDAKMTVMCDVSVVDMQQHDIDNARHNRAYLDDISADHIYTRDTTGTVVGVSTTFNVHRKQLVYVETRHAISGLLLHSELRFKKDVEMFFTCHWQPNPDFPHAHFDRDENTTTHYRLLE
jgi:hypothetical protein